jgi:hypothetical protein
MERIGLVLTPEPEIADRIVTAAQQLLPSVGPVRSMLGEGALPHMSFTHVRSSMEPEQVWAEVDGLFDVEQTIEIVTLGIRFHTYEAGYLAEGEGGPGITVFLTVQFDEGVREMRKAIETMSWMATGEPSYMPTGATIDPHFTLGSTRPGSGTTIQGPVEIPSDLLNITIPMKLALGPIGEFGVLENVLAGGW